jgi:ABC-2 type transport system permease protein/sodium transport system permease protein
MFPTLFLCNNLFPKLKSASLVGRLGLLAGSSALVFAGFPVLSAYLGRVRLRTGMQFRNPSWAAWSSALVLGLSLWLVVVQLLAWVLPKPDLFEQDNLDRILKPFREAQSQYPLVMTLAFVIPGLAEELFFRGYLFSAIRRKSGPATTIMVTALLFGFFHLIMPGPFPLYRFLSSTLLGLALGWIAWHSGSVFPPIIMHAVHNAMLVLAGPGEGMPELLPWSWFFAGLAGSLAGAVLLSFWGSSLKEKVIQ